MGMSGTAPSGPRCSLGRVMTAVAFAAVALACFGTENPGIAASVLVVAIPAMLWVRSRREFLTIAGILVLFCGLMGPLLRQSTSPVMAPRQTVTRSPNP
jgi:hypothetical protein